MRSYHHGAFSATASHSPDVLRPFQDTLNTNMIFQGDENHQELLRHQGISMKKRAVQEYKSKPSAMQETRCKKHLGRPLPLAMTKKKATGHRDLPSRKANEDQSKLERLQAVARSTKPDHWVMPTTKRSPKVNQGDATKSAVARMSFSPSRDERYPAEIHAASTKNARKVSTPTTAALRGIQEEDSDLESPSTAATTPSSSSPSSLGYSQGSPLSQSTMSTPSSGSDLLGSARASTTSLVEEVAKKSDRCPTPKSHSGDETETDDDDDDDDDDRSNNKEVSGSPMAQMQPRKQEKADGPRVRETWRGCFEKSPLVFKNTNDKAEDVSQKPTPNIHPDPKMANMNAPPRVRAPSRLGLPPSPLESSARKPVAVTQKARASSRQGNGKTPKPALQKLLSSPSGALSRTPVDSPQPPKVTKRLVAVDASNGPVLPLTVKPVAKNSAVNNTDTTVGITAKPLPKRNTKTFAGKDGVLRTLNSIHQHSSPGVGAATRKGKKRENETMDPESSKIDEQPKKKRRPADLSKQGTKGSEATDQIEGHKGSNTDTGTMAALDRCIDDFCNNIQDSVLTFRNSMKQALGLVSQTAGPHTRPPFDNLLRPSGQPRHHFLSPTSPLMIGETRNWAPAYGHAPAMATYQTAQVPGYDNATGTYHFMLPAAPAVRTSHTPAWGSNSARMPNYMQPALYVQPRQETRMVSSPLGPWAYNMFKRDGGSTTTPASKAGDTKTDPGRTFSLDTDLSPLDFKVRP